MWDMTNTMFGILLHTTFKISTVIHILSSIDASGVYDSSVENPKS